MKEILIRIINHILAAPSYLRSIPFHMVLFGIGVSAVILIFLFWIRGKRDEAIREIISAGGDRKPNNLESDTEISIEKEKAPEGQSPVQIICLALLVFYLVFLFILTTIARKPGIGYSYDLHILRGFRLLFRARVPRMTFYNLCMLMPIGALVPVILDFSCSWRDVLLLSFLATASIESTQFLFKLGCFELADLINNVLGAMIAYGIVKLIQWIYVRLHARGAIKRKEFITFK